MTRIKRPNNIYFASIEEANFSKFWLQKLETFPTIISKHCLKFLKEIDQKRRLLGYWLLEQHLIENGYQTTLLDDIGRDEFQKPFFIKCAHLKFNLSYSGEIAICAFSYQPIGIDIEKIDPKVNLEHYKSIFSVDVWTKIISSADPIFSFFTYWTQMESVMKADGHGITGPINKIDYGDKKISINNIERDIVFIPTLSGYMTHAVGTNLNKINVQRKYFEI